MLDCCYSGTVICDEKGGNRAGVKKKKFEATLERDLPDDRFVLTACAANEQAIELDTHKQGAFTFYLLQGLQGNVADKNKDRRVDVDEAFTFLQQRVSEVARLNKHQQTPTLTKGRASQPYYLRNDNRAMEILLEKPTELKTIDYLETKQEQVWLEGWVRYGTGVREVYVAQDKATLEDKGTFGTKFQLVVPLRLGKNVVSVTAVDKNGTEKPLIVTINRLEDVLVKLELRPIQTTCRPGAQVQFEVSGTTESGATTTSFMVDWQAKHGKMVKPGLCLLEFGFELVRHLARILLERQDSSMLIEDRKDQPRLVATVFGHVTEFMLGDRLAGDADFYGGREAVVAIVQ